jgi:hypothetical protein
VFITKTPIANNVNLDEINFKQNTYGAEAIFQRAFKRAGYSFKNPCFQIRGYHVHAQKVYFEDYNCIGTDRDFSDPPSLL